MSRQTKLSYDRGTLILHPPPRGKAWIDFATWDDRIEKFRLPALSYRPLMETLMNEGIELIDTAKEFYNLDIQLSTSKQPYPHQQEALTAWKNEGRKGVVVLPTAGGKTFLAQLAMVSTPRTTLIVVPTLDLMHQWYAEITASFPSLEVGLLGGGSGDRTPVLISTYHSAAIQAKTLGNRYGFLIFDECHHLPTDFFQVIATESIAPYRLGLTATPEREDGNHRVLDYLIGKIVYRKTPQDLSGKTLANHEVITIKVKLSPEEKKSYDQAINIRNKFLKHNNIFLNNLQGWQLFVQASSRTSEGRKAMLAHREAKEIANATQGKFRILAELIEKHFPDKMLIFTNDNNTVYRISQEYLIPAITHQTPVKERHEILTKYREEDYKVIVASHVLNEGVDVPSARIAIIISGTGSTREYIQRLGRVLRKNKNGEKLAILYEIITEETTEEKTSAKRKGIKNKYSINDGDTQRNNQTEIYLYPEKHQSFKAAESPTKWNE